jgi:hypothetical protein
MGLMAGWTGLRSVHRLDRRQSDGNRNLASADGCYYTWNQELGRGIQICSKEHRL